MLKEIDVLVEIVNRNAIPDNIIIVQTIDSRHKKEYTINGKIARGLYDYYN